MASWHTPATARAFWKDAAALNDEQVSVYLTVARSACLAYAPLPARELDGVTLTAEFEDGEIVESAFRFSADLAPDFTGVHTLSLGDGLNLQVTYLNGAPTDQAVVGEDIPENYRLAQAMHARNIYNAAKASPSADPETGFALTTTPLDWQVRQLLIPTKAFGGIA